MAVKAGIGAEKGAKRRKKTENGDVESVWTGVVERCGKRGGMWRKKTGGSFAPHGERVKKKDRKGDFHRNIHNVENPFPGSRQFYMP